MIDYEKLINITLKYADEGDTSALTDALGLCRELEKVNVMYVDNEELLDPDSFASAHFFIKRVIAASAHALTTGHADGMTEQTYRDALKFDAPYDFDAALIFAEFDRPYPRKFYEPRRPQLLPIVRALQDLADNKLDLLCISTPPGVGKSTLAIMYIVWEALKNPELTTLCGSHSNSFLRGVYDEILRMLEPGGEYLWSEIFPATHLVNTNARDMQIDLGRRKRFPTIETGSIGSGNAGRIRASGLLYCDDLIPDIETAMSKDRLDKLYQQYYTDLRQRKIGDCKELHIATRWSIYDVIGRLEAQYEDSKRAKFIRFAALDENDESNFDYPFHLGFTTEFYRQQRDIMDDASWRALYMNEPVEREGLLISAEELRRYFELPPGEPDAVISVCDTKDQGTDYCVMPVAYRYGQDYYIDTFICDNNTPDVVEERLVDTLVERRVAMCRFESNRAGGRVAQSVQKAVHERGGITNITTKWNQTNKETRIIVASGWIKTRCLFKDESLYKTDREYRTAMTMLTSYTLAGKNRHDDVPDAMSMLMDFAESFESQKVVLMKRPF